MADEEQLGLLRQGPAIWNAWRQNCPDVGQYLSGADLSGADLSGADLNGVNLRRADLRWANLKRANLSWANLSKADLSKADLSGADFSGADFSESDLSGVDFSGSDLSRVTFSGSDLSWADLSWANLCQANLSGANLSRTNLNEANLSGVRLFETIFAGVDLSGSKGLESCTHAGPSIIDYRTLQQSGPLPLGFLRGMGLPDNLIDYLPSLLGQAIEFYSCFISYSSKDQAFAERLHADLQARGVRCWFAPEDLKIGDRLLETIDMAIRLRDKLLLLLSETSVASAWVLKEVRTALREEDQHGRTVLFPVRLDNALMDTTEQWAHDLRRTRHIGDFTRWKDHDAYSKGLERLLRDLKVKGS